MFSRLETIFRSEFRQTEKTDTRQQITRQNKDFQRKKHKEKKKDDALLSSEDDTAVSIRALSIFLKGLLPGEEDDIKNNKENDPANKVQNKAKNPNTVKAINAYERSSADKASSYNALEKTANNYNLSAEEENKIKKILDNLELLKDKNLEYLTLKPAPTFLESLDKAIGLLIKRHL
jgi:hypothetical protein